MSLFEYVTVAVSIVLSLGVVRLLDGLRFSLSRDRGYWVHSVWIATKLLQHALYWWGLWQTRESVSWNFISFMWVLLFPGTLYLQSTALVTTAPGDVPSWREHFQGIRAWFFGINLILILHVMVSSVALLGVPLLELSRVPLAVVFVLSALGLRSASPLLQAVIAVTVLVTNILGFGSVWFEPAARTAGDG